MARAGGAYRAAVTASSRREGQRSRQRLRAAPHQLRCSLHWLPSPQASRRGARREARRGATCRRLGRDGSIGIGPRSMARGFALLCTHHPPVAPRIQTNPRDPTRHLGRSRAGQSQTKPAGSTATWPVGPDTSKRTRCIHRRQPVAWRTSTNEPEAFTRPSRSHGGQAQTNLRASAGHPAVARRRKNQTNPRHQTESIVYRLKSVDRHGQKRPHRRCPLQRHEERTLDRGVCPMPSFNRS